MTPSRVQAALLALLLTACGASDEFNADKRSVSSEDDSADATKTGQKNPGKTDADNVDDASGAGDTDLAGEDAGDGQDGALDGEEAGAELPEAPGSAGKVSDVTSLGRVYGYAYDPSDATLQVDVSFFVGGPMGTGTAAGTTTANKAGPDGSTPGDHAFFVDLPEAMRDGAAKELYAYAMIGGAPVLLGTAFDYTAYAFSQAGRDYYNATVRPQLAACGGCHTLSYEQQFYSLIAPSPAQGGTAINNQLLNKPSQTNNTSHGGGQLCGSANAAPCAQIQEWWRREFGP